MWAITEFSCRMWFVSCTVSLVYCSFPRMWASTISSRLLKSSAFCFAPILFQIFAFEFLQGLPLWSNLVKIFISFFTVMPVVLFLSSLFPVFFPTSFSSAFVPLEKYPKETCSVFHIFFPFPFIIHQTPCMSLITSPSSVPVWWDISSWIYNPLLFFIDSSSGFFWSGIVCDKTLSSVYCTIR